MNFENVSFISPREREREMEPLNLTDFEGGLDRGWVELTEMRLKDARVLDEHGSPGCDQGVQSVEEDEAYRHVTWSGESDKGGDC